MSHNSIFGIPIKINNEKFDSIEIDEVRNYFANKVEGVKLWSFIGSDIWEFNFSNTPYFFKIPGDGTLSKITFYNDITSKKYTVEEFLFDKDVPESVKKIVTWNIEIFSRNFKRAKFGWTISENIGVGLYNAKALAKLNVKED